MIECDDANWPLAITIAEDAMTRADHRRFLRQFGRWLDRAEPFVLLRIFVSQAAAEAGESGTAEMRAWLQDNAARMCAFVLAIATAVPRRHEDPAFGIEPDWPPGIPARLFRNGASAIAWLRRDILDPAGMTVDL